jgi:hypothetical protein
MLQVGATGGGKEEAIFVIHIIIQYVYVLLQEAYIFIIMVAF